MLSRELANQGHYPAIDVLRSTSRLLPHIVDRDTLRLVQQTVAALSVYEKNRELIEIGAYRAGNNPETDRAIKLLPELNKFLRQDMGDWIARDDALRALKATLGREKVS